MSFFCLTGMISLFCGIDLYGKDVYEEIDFKDLFVAISLNVIFGWLILFLFLYLWGIGTVIERDKDIRKRMLEEFIDENLEN